MNIEKILKKTGNILIWKNGDVKINPKFAVYMQTTQGIPPEALEGAINKSMPHGSTQRAYQIFKASDVAKGTNNAEIFLKRIKKLDNMPPEDATALLDSVVDDASLEKAVNSLDNHGN